MARTTPRKRLVCHIAHAPHLECCFPILARLHTRGRVDVTVYLNRRLKKTDPAVTEAFSQTGLPPTWVSRSRIELGSFFDMKRADAVLSYGDPLALRLKVRPRDRFLRASGTPSIFIQHGLIQEGINMDWEHLGPSWYSDLILWWDGYDPALSGFLSRETLAKVRKVGFIKKSMLPPRRYPQALLDQLATYRKVLLVCTNIPGQSFRFSDDSLRALYGEFDAFCRRNRDILFLVRPHRGKNDDLGRGLDAALNAAHDNVMVMDRYSGPFAYATMHDSLQISDMVIGHASTAILDALYADKPTGMLQNDWPAYDPLPEVNTLAALEDFMDGADSFDVSGNPVRRRFGEIEANIDKAAQLIEALMIDGAVPSGAEAGSVL